jgi:hypothetical protein
MSHHKKRQRRASFLGLIATILTASMILAACGPILGKDNVTPSPTRFEQSFEQYETSLPYTQNAPPEDFDTVSFPEIDDNLPTTVYSRFELTVNFDGYYTDTSEPVDGFMRLKAWNDEFNVARQIQIEFLGDVFSGGASNLDVVRINNSYYMINPNGVCITDQGQVAELANIRAGQLIGGVEFAQPTSNVADINGFRAWQYGFDEQFINPPAIQFEGENNELDYLSGAVWVSPEHNVVVRYTVEMNVHHATLLFGERPVTGRIRYQYDVYDIGLAPIISIPNGC